MDTAANRKGRHLTGQERYDIWLLLEQGHNFKEIGAALGKDATTISKEIKKHRYFVKAKRRVEDIDHPCRLKASCRKRDICIGKKCRIPCRKCLQCHRHCGEFTPTLCDINKKPPFVCNGCGKRPHGRCKEDKYFYGAKQAQKEYEASLSESRKGIDLTRDEVAALEELAAPLIAKGQPINHIYANHADEIPVSKRTFYRYVHDGDIGIKSIDLRRAVKYKKRRRSRTPKPDPAKKKGHTYDCFENYVKEHPQVRVTELDTVEGRKGGKLLMTMLLRDVPLLLAFPIDNKEMDNTVGVMDEMEECLGTKTFKKTFPLFLPDNGGEFADPKRFETGRTGKSRTKMFYCEPYKTNQKSRLEKEHEFIRYILPKGTSFDDLSDENVRDIVSHIGSTVRAGLGNKSPIELAIKKGLGPILEKLGIRPIPPDEVCLTKDLITTR
jgi:IS30 family transposase